MRTSAGCIAFVVLALVVTGCQQENVGEFTVISTRPVDAKNFRTDGPKTTEQVVGEDTKSSVMVEMGQPDLEVAVERALEGSHSQMLTNVVVYYEHWFIPHVYGESKFIVKGNPAKQ